MHVSGPAESTSASSQPEPDDQETPDVARARLAAALRDSRQGMSQQAQDAFAQVPRHLFVPEAGTSAAYRDEAFVIKCGDDGLPVSSSSQPAMMAIMLEQLMLEPGHRVLEIGAGSGYNAAVMSAIVGTQGTVVSVDIDAELVARARSSLAAAGFPAVIVRCADGGYGYPDEAPFDRIIVTAGAWDIAPAWVEQLTQGGRLVLPLSVRGIQLSVALEEDGDRWVSRSACRCGFVRMLGAFAAPEAALRLGEPHSLYALVSDGGTVDAQALQAALAGSHADAPTGLAISDPAETADLDIWLTLTCGDLDRVTLLAAPGNWLPLTPMLPFGGLVSQPTDPGAIGVALLLPEGSPSDSQYLSDAGLLVRGFGPGGAALADRLAARAGTWQAIGRPGTSDLQLSVWPAGSPVPELAGQVIMDRPHARIQAGWSA